MASTERTAPDSLELLRQLEATPYKFEFLQALRLLECARLDKPRIGESKRVSDDAIRLSQTPSLAFAPATCSSGEFDRTSGTFRLSVRFMGLFGPNGPMPLHITEYARNRIHHERDMSMVRFFDMFHHRMLMLFYRAWAKSQPTVQFDRPDEDRFSTYVASLIGLGDESLRDRDEFPDRAKLFHAGRLAPQTRNAEGLQAIIKDFFGLPVAIEQFVGQWTEIPEQCRCILGPPSESTALGEATTIGSHVWDCQQKFRIRIGPVGLEDYQRLLPGGDSIERLKAIVKNYIGFELMWDVQLVLLKSEAPPIKLGQMGQLGRTTWLDNRAIQQDADDLVLSAGT